MNRFLFKSWVYPFYKTYSGFLFVVFLIAAGVLRGDEHIALGYFFTSHVKNLIYPLAIVILYESLSIYFCIRWISMSRNRIIRDILFLGRYNRFKGLFLVLIYLHLPVIIYTLFLIIISIATGQIMVSAILIVLAFIRSLIYVMVFNRKLIYPVERSFTSQIRISLPTYLNFPIINFSLKHIFSQKLLSFLLSKLMSIGVLLISIFLLQTVDAYSRFVSFSIFLVFISNAFLSYDLFKFHHIDLSHFRSLPIQSKLFLVKTCILLIMLTLPEIIIIYRNFSQLVHAGFISLYIINGLMILLLLYAYLLYFKIDLKTYIIRIFWGSLILVFLLLFDVPAYILLIILGSATFYFYFRGFYSFEMIYDQTQDV
jgi:hypothetical protein